ncbi:hypothetical protein AHiyo8_18020 [Arthrobacter sp. Hiyo8]|nr:hypothetical protein AHiyo8_18020 [Arthrobacter sp. Hiyo8]
MADQLGVVGGRREGALKRLRGEFAGGVNPLAEAHHAHLADNVPQGRPGVRAVGIRDQEANRIGPAVNRSYAVHTLSPLRMVPLMALSRGRTWICGRGGTAHDVRQALRSVAAEVLGRASPALSHAPSQ